MADILVKRSAGLQAAVGVANTLLTNDRLRLSTKDPPGLLSAK